MSVISDIRLLKERQSGCQDGMAKANLEHLLAGVDLEAIMEGQVGHSCHVFFYWPSLQDSNESWGRLIG